MANLTVTGNLSVGGGTDITAQQLRRVQIQTYADQTGRYYPICKFNYPYTEQGSNGACIQISGRIGGYTTIDNAIFIDGLLSNRSNPSGRFQFVGRTQQALQNCTLVLRRDSNNVDTLYVKTIGSWCKVDLTIQWFPRNQVEFLFDYTENTYSTSPAGTDVWSLYDATAPEIAVRSRIKQAQNISSGYTYTNDTGRGVVCHFTLQSYQNWATCDIKNAGENDYHQIMASQNLTNSERSIANFTVFLGSGSSVRVSGFSTDKFNNTMDVMTYR